MEIFIPRDVKDMNDMMKQCKTSYIVSPFMLKSYGIATIEATKILHDNKVDIIFDITGLIAVIAKQMNLDIKTEVREADDIFSVTMVSDNNPILIGKDGRTINAMQLLIRQALQNQTRMTIKVNLDASNYKAKKIKKFEFEIKNIVREVQKTKTDAKLDPMNSYQRRIVHSLISGFSNVETESVGEEPNRCVVIKYVGD